MSALPDHGRLPSDLPADRRRRERLVRDLREDCPDPRVADAIAATPRHWFVPGDAVGGAYADGALPIGAGQTISQPRVVARMLSALRLGPGQRVLDVGAGSGWAAALIARLVDPATVMAVERQASLIPRTAALLERIAPAVRLVHGDGLDQPGPWDAIHIGCACSEEPAALVAALADGGRLIAPIGPHDGAQVLTLVERTAGGLRRSTLGEVLFVPALRGTVAAPDQP